MALTLHSNKVLDRRDNKFIAQITQGWDLRLSKETGYEGEGTKGPTS